MKVRSILSVLCLSVFFAAAAGPALGCDGKAKSDTQSDSRQASADTKDSK